MATYTSVCRCGATRRTRLASRNARFWRKHDRSCAGLYWLENARAAMAPRSYR